VRVNLGGILEGEEADPDGVFGARSGVHRGGVGRKPGPLSRKENFSLEMACFGELWAYF